MRSCDFLSSPGSYIAPRVMAESYHAANTPHLHRAPPLAIPIPAGASIPRRSIAFRTGGYTHLHLNRDT